MTPISLGICTECVFLAQLVDIKEPYLSGQRRNRQADVTDRPTSRCCSQLPTVQDIVKMVLNNFNKVIIMWLMRCILTTIDWCKAIKRQLVDTYTAHDSTHASTQRKTTSSWLNQETLVLCNKCFKQISQKTFTVL